MSKWSPGIQKVLAHVAVTEGWHLQNHAAIRRGHDERCPIESCAGVRHGQLFAARARLGLTPEEHGAIVTAADGWRHSCIDPALRAALLKAAGLA